MRYLVGTMATQAAARYASDAVTVGCVNIATANGGRDGSGALGLVKQSGATLGTRISWVRVQALGETTEGMVRLFYWDGSAYFLVAEILVSAIAPSGSVQAFGYDYVPPRDAVTGQSYMVLPATCRLYASTERAEGFAVSAWGANL